MKIKKRDGHLEQLSFDKIIYRLRKLCTDKNLGELSSIDPDVIAQRVVSSIYDGVTSCELDEEAARIAVSMIENLEYQKLASRIIISNLHKSTIECFSEVMENLYNNVDKNGNSMPIIADDIIEIVRKHKNTLNFAIDYKRDYLFDYFGFKTLEKSYLMKIFNKEQNKMVVVERPQHMYMRVALGIHKNDIESALSTYNLISQHYYTHASPTIFNAGGRLANLSSCFLMGTDDSIEGIFKTMTDCAKISKVGGGIGTHISNIRAKGSLIRGTNGISDGIIPMLKVYNEIGLYINQSGKRKGSFAMYIEPWHADIMEFLELRKNQGHENLRARDLFYAMWTPDLFMKQVEKDGDWYLMCPDECPGLNTTYGDDFEKLYWKYVEEKRYKRIVKAQDVWTKIMDSQIETGVPYIAYKDNVNKKCNQKNLGTIKSSNLCVAPETMILTSKGYYKIDKLENREVEVWNGKEFSKTIIQKTGENQELLKVKLSNGSELQCTPYHKFYIVTGKRPSAYPIIKKIDAKDLIKGMKLIKSEYPVITKGDSNFPYPYEHGLFCADGTYEHNSTNSNLPRITLYADKKMLLPYIKTRIDVCEEDSFHRINCRLPKDIKPKFIVPINCNIDIKLRWFEGLCDGDGCIIKSDNLTGIQISSIHCDFLTNVKYLLQTMGCDPKINMACNAGYRTLPDGKGGHNEYYCKQIYRMCITSYDVATLYKYGFRPKRLKITGIYPKNNTKRWIQINDIEYTRRISDTYCFTEEKRGMGIFNGILTGQCAEISLYSDDKEYAVCFTGDTQILTKQGYRRIDECNNQEVLSYFNNDIDFKEQQQFVNTILIDNGIKDVYELECNGTKSIKTTENHLFAVLDERNNNTKVNTYKWVKLKDLTLNDKILLPKTKILPNYDIDIIKTCNQDYLTIGWMVGDDWQFKSKCTERSTYGVCFGPNETYARNIVIETLVKWCDNSDFTKNGHNKNSKSFYTDRNGVYNWASSKKNFIKYIKDTYGLYEKTAHFKCIPDKIKKSQPIEIASFLSGLFSADGSVYIQYKHDNNNKNNKRNRFNVNLSSSSKYLLDDVQQMLKCFGIESRTVFGDVKNRNNQQGKLSIENKDSLLNFNKYINFMLCKEKQQQLECGLKIFKKRNIFREYTKLKSIKYIGKERVYDLNVPNTHNFIAEGYVVHNCNLASVALPKFVEYDNDDKPYFNFEKLREIAKYIVGPMNKVIDHNHYPVPETHKSNMAHRPIGIGVQGLSDVYIKMKLPFESEGAKKLNKEIFETLYYGCLQGTIEEAKRDGSYSTYEGSPFSQGKLQFDLCKEFDNINLDEYLSGRWDWDGLKRDLKQYGARNSMLIALMPTASTAQIMNNSECFEPIDSCIFKRRVLSGEYIVINKYLVSDLEKLGLWSKEMKDKIIALDGSIQKIAEIPDDIKAIYKTVWELSMKSVIEQSRDRGVFVDQMQSMNLFMANPNYKKLTSMHFYAWKQHLKTGMYYLRSRGQSSGKFSVDVNIEKQIREKQEKGEALTKQEEEAVLACSLENPEACMLCSS